MALPFLNLLCCPDCRGELSQIEDSLVCQGCGKIFRINNGVPSFLNQTDEFYEGRFTATTHKISKNPLRRVLYNVYASISIDCSRERFLNKVFKNKSSGLILDLRCGGGWTCLSQFGEVVGVDISLQSLQNARDTYALAVHCNTYNLPFRDNSFDLVCSFDFLGHIPTKNKGRLLSEIYRVTKKGGYTAHHLECDSQGFLFRWARQYPDLYQKYFIEMYGHYGLELPTIIFERFRQIGFTPVIEKADPCYTVLRPIQSYAVFFDNEFKNKSIWVKTLAIFSKMFLQHPILCLSANFLLGFFVPLSDLLTRVNSRGALQILYRKEEGLVTNGGISEEETYE